MRARVRRWTVEEYEKLGDDPAFRRTELIRGLIVNKMSKPPPHSNATTRFYVFLVRHMRPEFVVRQEQPLRLRDSMPEPDSSVVRGSLSDFDIRHSSTRRSWSWKSRSAASRRAVRTPRSTPKQA